MISKQGMCIRGAVNARRNSGQSVYDLILKPEPPEPPEPEEYSTVLNLVNQNNAMTKNALYAIIAGVGPGIGP